MSEKRNRILITAIKLFNERGFHGTATAAIAKAAGVANGTLFQYFNSKENLVLECYVSIKEEIQESVDDKLSDIDDLYERIRLMWYNSLQWALQNKEKFDFLQQFYASPYVHKLDKAVIAEYTKTHMEVLQRAIDQGLIKELPPELLYSLISSHTYGIYQYIKQKNMSPKSAQHTIDLGFDSLWKMMR